MRKAFTFVEIVIVLAVIGILATIGTDIIIKAYENYIISKQLSSSNYTTEVALQQLQRRLEYRIPYSEVSIKDSTNANTIVPLSYHDNTHKILAWVGRAYEALRGESNGTINYPGWSGFADLNASDTQSLFTPGSKLTYAKNVINNLTSINLSAANNGVGISFVAYPDDSEVVKAYGWKYAATGNTNDKATFIFPVHSTSDTNLTYDDTTPSRIYEHYYLSYSAYAVVPEDTDGDGFYKLWLYYDFRPWMGERFSDGKKSLLADGVTKFRFRRIANSIELYLCAASNIRSDINVTICGKKVVY